MKGGLVVSETKYFHSLASFESLRKQAKKLVRLFISGDPDALARVHSHLPTPAIPLSLRDAQLVIAREHGFAGWQNLRAAALRQEGKGLEWAASEAERAIHDNKIDLLTQLLQEFPALVSWRNDSGESLLSFATGSFGDSGDSYREQMFTRPECAEFLLDAGAGVDAAIWESAMRSRAEGVLKLLRRKGALPSTLDILAALGDEDGVRDSLVMTGDDAEVVTRAVVCACRIHHREVAALLLDRSIELDPVLGRQVEAWRGRSGLVDYLIEHPREYASPWLTVVMNELLAAIDNGDLVEFNRWLRQEPDVLGEASVSLIVDLIEHAVLKDRGAFIACLMELDPALLQTVGRYPSSAIVFALEYGKAHLVPLLTQIWSLPGDLAHSAGVGDFARVKAWFDEAGHARLGSLSRQYPTNRPSVLRNLHWNPANAQQVLDVALAWACMNRQLEIASFLLERGANIDTDWSTHEPAGILHECAVKGMVEVAQFLIDHGIDMTRQDYRWNGTAEGWARYAAQDEEMAEFLANAQRQQEARSPTKI
jgi:hypothetical protein